MKYHKRNYWSYPYHIFIRINGYNMKQPEPRLCCCIFRGRNVGFNWWSCYIDDPCSITTLKDRKKGLIVGWKNWGSRRMGGRRGMI